MSTWVRNLGRMQLVSRNVCRPTRLGLGPRRLLGGVDRGLDGAGKVGRGGAEGRDEGLERVDERA